MWNPGDYKLLRNKSKITILKWMWQFLRVFHFQTENSWSHHTWYLSQISQMRYVEKNLSCQCNFKFLHMTDVEKSEVSPHLACVWCGECLYICTRYAVLLNNSLCRDLRCFVAKSVLSRYTHFCVEKNWTKDCVCGEKMTNIRYAPCHLIFRD